MIAMKVMTLPAGTHSRGVQEGWNSLRQAKKHLQIQRHLMLRHTLSLDRQTRLDKGTLMAPNDNLMVKIKRLVRTSLLGWRDISESRVKGEISCV